MPRLLDLLKKHGIPASFFVPAVSALLYPDEQRRVVAEGHEVGIHGWIHERNSTLPKVSERDLMFRAGDTLEKITGVRPVGMRTPSWDFSPDTLSIVREMGLLYDSSLMADDEPYELLEDNQPTGVVELPPEWIRDDAVYFGMVRSSTLRPYTPPSSVLEIFKAEFDGAYREGGLFIPDHASAHHRPPFARRIARCPDRLHRGPSARVVRDPRRHRGILQSERAGLMPVRGTVPLLHRPA